MAKGLEVVTITCLRVMDARKVAQWAEDTFQCHNLAEVDMRITNACDGNRAKDHAHVCVDGRMIIQGSAYCAPQGRRRHRRVRVISCGVISTALISLNVGCGK